MIVKKVMESKNPLIAREITKVRIDADYDIEKILQPSDIGAVIPLDTCTILSINGVKKYINSTSLIDAFISGEYDDYEVTCIRSENYGWLMIELTTLED